MKDGRKEEREGEQQGRWVREIKGREGRGKGEWDRRQFGKTNEEGERGKWNGTEDSLI